MTEEAASAELAFLEHVAQDPEWARAALKRIDAYNLEHGAKYGDDPVPVALKPNFISPAQEQLLRRASHALWGALETFVEVFLDTPSIQDAWDVGDEELELYRIDPGYPDAIQISRFDGFLQGSKLKFLEFNCDSPGGAGYGDVIHDAFLEMVRRRPELGEGIRVEPESRIARLHEALVDCYTAWRQETPDRPSEPRIVLADWPDVGSRPDIDITVERLRQLGADAAFADPRELTLDGDRLLHEGEPVDVLYKRVIMKELLAEPEANDVVEAYRDGAVCMVNAPRSVIVGNKRILAALRQPSIQEQLTPTQRAAVDRFVPWTAVLRDGTVDIDGLSVELRDLLLDNKDAFVLKPTRGYGGEGVHLGFETSAETWGALVDEHLDEDGWIAQRLAEIPTELVPEVHDDEVQFDLVNVNVNPFVFGGRYGGSYTRISRANVINVSHGGGLVPTITAERPLDG